MIESTIKILIACHKFCDVPEDPIYLPMHVGSAGKEIIPGFIRDDTGENISKKNPVYCELTGLYWAWKNLNCEYLGLVHYRRYFTLKRGTVKKGQDPLKYVLKEDEAAWLLKKYRILVPKKRRYYIETIYSHYAHTFDGTQLEKTRGILKKLFPEYVSCFDYVMKQTEAYIYNMFLMPKDLADAYCKWLFNILRELEKCVVIDNMTDFEKRYAGRVSERLLNVWLLRQIETGTIKREEIGEIPVIYTARINWGRKIAGFLAAKLFGRKYTGSF